MKKEVSGTSKRAAAIPPLPAQARVTKDKTHICQIEGDEHTLTKIGQWLPKDKTIIAIGIEDVIYNGEPRKAIKFQVPDKRQPGKWLYFALVMDDVELTPLPN